MAAGGYFLLFFTGPVTLADAAARLEQHGMHVARTADGLAVRWRPDSEPVLWVGLSREPHVAGEATDIAGTYDTRGMADLDQRFEVGFDDLEAVLDEINTLIEVQGALQDLTHGYLFLPWNQSVVAPE